MKMRLDFVTNSSSSSYLVVYKINDSQEFRDYIKEEYGKHGVNLFNSEMKSWNELDKDEKEEIVENLIEDYWDLEKEEREKVVPDCIKENDKFVYGNIYTYTTEGDQDSEVILISQDLPEEFAELIYEGN